MVNISLLIVLELKTSYEIWFGSLVDYSKESKLKVFNYLVYTHVKEYKLGPKVRKCIFLSYVYGVEEYQLWCVDLKLPKFITSRDVTFDEYVMLHKKKKSTGIDVEIDQGTTKQVEFEIEASKTMQKYA